MSQRVRALRGFNDILPDAAAWWRGVLERATRVMDQYAYRPIHLPLMEATELFSRSVGETTDIVAKEMFTFLDREKTSMSLRPEGTAGCVRAGIDHGLLHNQQQRFWYAGPMFRHERPQAGRYRQFEQIGVEAFGMAQPEIDVEVIALSSRLLRALGLQPGEGLQLELNTIGSSEARAAYRDRLVDYLRPFAAELDEDSQRRLDSNPLRIFDSKVARTREIVAAAPAFEDHLDAPSREHFEAVKAGLDALGIAYVLNPRLVRGLDYYGRTVFEWTTDRLGAQGTICAGGRYDALVSQLGGGEVPAVGFALGLERTILLLQALDCDVRQEPKPQLYFCSMDGTGAVMSRLAESLRDAGLRVQCDGSGKLKAQLKRADQAGAAYAAILGGSEAQARQIQIKPLQGDGEAQLLGWDELVAQMMNKLDGHVA